MRVPNVLLKPFAILAAFMPPLLSAADPVKEQDELMRSLQRLVPQNAAGATVYRSTIVFVRNDQGVKVTLTETGPAPSGDRTGPQGRTVSQTLTMPGDCAKVGNCVFKMTDGIVEFHGTKDTYNLGPYDIPVAQDIVDALNRLKASVAAQLNAPKK